MLDTVSELSEDAFRNIGRGLGHEIYSDALASDKPYYLLDLVHESLGGVVEEHMGFVEEEDQFRKVHVSDFRKSGIEVREEPEQEGRVKLRVEHQLVGRKDVHDAFSAFALEEVIDVEVRLAEELVCTLVL